MKLIKALLVSLPWATYQGPSLSIGTLAAYAKKKGFDVDSLHLHINVAALFGLKNYDQYSNDLMIGEVLSAAILFPEKQKELIELCGRNINGAKRHHINLKRILKKIYMEIDWSNYDLVGFTTSYQQLFSSLIIAKSLKDDFPNIKTIIGGRLVSGDLGLSILKVFPQIDYCVDGEGEIPLISLLNGLEQEKEGFEEKVPSLMYRKKDKCIANPKEQLKTLKGLPDPDYKHYYKMIEEHPALKNRAIISHLSLEASRGCLYSCTFCSMRRHYGSYRERPPSEVASSIKRMSDIYQICSIFLSDLNVHSEHGGKLFSLISEQKRDYRIYCEFRADMSKNDLLKMKRAGLDAAHVGLEALDTNLLKKMRKGTRLIDNLLVMKFCEELGIDYNYNLILGFPTETQTNINRSIQAIEYASSYSPPTALQYFSLYEGSPVFCSPQRYGIFEVTEHSEFFSRLPPRIAAELKLLKKSFKTKHKVKDYSKLKKKIANWRKKYKNAIEGGCPLLYYIDCVSFLTIEDFREGINTITLEGWAREFYLFCDSIRSIDEIKKRFPDVNDRELKKTLNELFKLKVMFREANSWLSLAVHFSPKNRRHVQFL